MASLADLAINIPVYGKKIEGGVNRLIQELAVETIHYVAEATPVDTGNARSNWQLSLGVENEQTIPPHFPGKHLGRGETKNLDQVVTDAFVEVMGRTPGVPVFIQNNVDYIQTLNTGTSTQAPAAFVEDAVQKAVAWIKTARLGL